MIRICFNGESIFHVEREGSHILGYTIVPLCWLLDIPLSVINDTLCLPGDLLNKKKTESNDRLQGTLGQEWPRGPEA